MHTQVHPYDIMNLYIFNQTRRGTVFGVGTYIHELTAALKDSGINICVMNLTSDKPQIQKEEIDGIEHWHISKVIADQRTTSDQQQWELYFHNVVYLLRLHVKDTKDLIFQLNFFESGKLAEELKNTFACRIVSVIHFTDWGFTIYDNPERLRRMLKEEHPDNIGEKLQKSFEEEKSYYLKADRIICLSNYMKEIMCRDYGLDANRISVIPNGLSDAKLQNDICGNQSNLRYLRAKWNMSKKEKVILFAGRIDEVKGVSYLIKAFREVLKKNPNCRLVIAGSGDYDKFFQEAKDICTKITFTGLLEKEELHEIYRIADVGVVPSLFEPFGYVAVEMMMHELPVVATATSGLNEVVDDTCGLKIPIIIKPDTVEIDAVLLSEKILYLLQHPTEAKQMGQNGRKRYLKNYSSEIFRKNMLQMYQSECQYRDNKIKTLIVTGQNSHHWEVSHVAIKQILENSGLFTVDVAISPKAGDNMSNFKPDFESFQLVVLDYCGDRWPEETEQSFLNFVEKDGGGSGLSCSEYCFQALEGV